ncbi:protein JASON-like [Oryza brachyantha]|uniref:protein JASON-like n=1 Tax=Oryza brachyantha TaxID=4533 RepID=UPI001ADB623E|nr:protein JASON-like [Oryza brachyantha]
MCRYAATIARAVVEFLDAVLVGFFLSFFDSPARKVPLGELLLSDGEQGFGASRGSHEDLGEDCGIAEELMSEANYLKLIGAIPETPAELQSASCQINLEHYIEHDSFLTNAPAVVEASPAFEAKSFEGLKCEEDHTFIPELKTEDTKHLPLVESVYQPATGDKSPFENIKSMNLGSGDSPFPTPLVLRDDMQTPGTVCTSHKGPSGKPVRTRKQFVYPIVRPIENKLRQMELTEESSKPSKRRNLSADSIKKPQLTSSDSVEKGESPDSLPLPKSKCQLGIQRQLGDEIPKSISDENLEVCSLSNWLKPSAAGNENEGPVECSVGSRSYDEKNLLEGHVFMATESKWDEENPTPRLSKPLDFHGIPNTTKKYQEDQKIKWHSTPFEERLLKVLSEEEVPPTRKLVRGRLFYPEERV